LLDLRVGVWRHGALWGLGEGGRRGKQESSGASEANLDEG
jgi:hypothetical protein